MFAYPLESNFSGARYGLEPITQLQQHGVELLGHGGQSGQPKSRAHWHVFLDAAKACGSSPPDLRQASADFVVSLSSPHDRAAHRWMAAPVSWQEARFGLQNRPRQAQPETTLRYAQ